MHGAAVGAQEARFGETFAREILGGAAGARRQLRPRQQGAPGAGHVAERIETEIDIERCGIGFPLRYDFRHQHGNRTPGEGRGFHAQRDQIEHHPRQRLVERVCCLGDQAEAACRRRAGEHQRQPGGAVFQVLQGLAVGDARVGMIDPLCYQPGHRRASGDRRSAVGARIKRLDPQAVIGLAHKALVEAGALQRRLDQLAPVLLGGGGKLCGEGEIV